jgi:hypothetical protein
VVQEYNGSIAVQMCTCEEVVQFYTCGRDTGYVVKVIV